MAGSDETLKFLPRRRLGQTGLEVSVLGFGASPLGNVFGDLNEAEGVLAVKEAVRQGINFIDVSPFYGDTLAETNLGKALKDIPRDQFVLSTKVGRYSQSTFDFSAERVTRSVDESLRRLNVEYIDIIQCHDIEFGDLDQICTETLPALQKLKAEGKVHFVGITGLPLKIYEYVLEKAAPGSVDVALSYCHYSLNDSSLAESLPFLEGKGVGVISASPLSMGLLTPGGPPEWHPAPQEVKDACAAAAARCGELGVSLPHLALQYAVAEERIATTLVGMHTRQQVSDNIAAVLEGLAGNTNNAALAEVEQILKHVKNVTWPSGLPQNN